MGLKFTTVFFVLAARAISLPIAKPRARNAKLHGVNGLAVELVARTRGFAQVGLGRNFKKYLKFTKHKRLLLTLPHQKLEK